MQKKKRERLSKLLVEIGNQVSLCGSMENALKKASKEIDKVVRLIGSEDITREEIVVLCALSAGANTVDRIRRHLGCHNYFQFPEAKRILESLSSKFIVYYEGMDTWSLTSFFEDSFNDDENVGLLPSFSRFKTMKELFRFLVLQIDNSKTSENRMLEFLERVVTRDDCDPETRAVVGQAFSSGLEDNVVQYVICILFRCFQNGRFGGELRYCINDENMPSIGLLPNMLVRTALDTSGIFEPDCENGMASNKYFVPTEKLYELAPSMRMENEEDLACLNSNVIKSSDINKVELYFCEETQGGYDRLSYMLSEEGYDKVMSRMEKNGMRRNMTCLLYGGPGTGKTESVRQLARESGRDIVMLDLSKLRNKYVGESEKNVARAFNDYRKLCELNDRKPIMLINEADAALGKRNSNSEHAVDKMETAMTDIFLNEMDNFVGIMMATTNLTGMFDDAFERRFLFKVEFKAPDEGTRLKMWLSKMKGYGEDMLRPIASKYDFTGAEIENITKKALIESLFTENETLSAEEIDTICSQERIKSRSSLKKVAGFAG